MHINLWLCYELFIATHDDDVQFCTVFLQFEVGAMVRCVRKRAEDLLLCELAGRLGSLTLAEE